MNAPSDSHVLALLSNTVGPAPWYWNTFPELESRGRRLRWRYNEAGIGRTASVLLQVEGAENVLLVIAMYSRVFRIPPNLVGVWFEEGRRIRVFILDPDSLIEFQMGERLPDGVEDHGGFACSGGVVGEYWTSTDLEEGEHPIQLPGAFAGLDQLFLIGSYSRIQVAACSAIFEIRSGVAPGTRRLGVYPQKWFNRDDFDFGYQWITRVARDPGTDRIVGHGIRLTPFVLQSDGCHIDRWIRQDPRLPPGYSFYVESPQ